MKKIVLVLLFITDFIFYIVQYNKYDWKENFGYNFKNPQVFNTNINDYISDLFLASDLNKKKSPIILFGCSYAHGFNLKYNQKFGYKLSRLLNRNIYNRALPASNYSFMYWQTTQDEFYKQVPPSKNIIFLLNLDQFRRSYVYTFFPLLKEFYIHYSIKNDKLILDNYKNPIINFIKSSYIIKTFNHFYVNNYISNSKNYEKITDDILLYFIKTRENLEKNWEPYKGKINFTVILYETSKCDFKKLLEKKFINNGFNFYSTTDLVNEDLNLPEYMSKDLHPTEAAWDLLTPLIAENIKIVD